MLAANSSTRMASVKKGAVDAVAEQEDTVSFFIRARANDAAEVVDQLGVRRTYQTHSYYGDSRSESSVSLDHVNLLMWRARH